MAVNPTYPGVYIEEIPSGVHTIVGVATSITAFVGVANRGPIDEAVHIFSFRDYERRFGGIDKFPMGYAVSQFFLNGGGEAYIVRLARGAERAFANVLDANGNALAITALDQGASANDIQLQIGANPINPSNFDLTLNFVSSDNSADNKTETFQNLSLNKADTRFVEDLVNDVSQLVTVAVTPSNPASVFGVPTVLAPAHGGIISGAFTDADLNALKAFPNATHNSFKIGFNGNPATETVTIDSANPGDGSNLGAYLKDVAHRIESKVREAHPDKPAWSGFTCVSDGTQLILSSGTPGTTGSVAIAVADNNSIVNDLKLNNPTRKPRTPLAPAHGGITSDKFKDTELPKLNTLPDTNHNGFKIGFDGNAPVNTVKIDSTPITDNTLPAYLAKIAARIQSAVRAVNPNVGAWRDFTCVPSADNTTLVLSSGTPGGASAVAITATDTASIVTELHLDNVTVNKPDVPSLSGGAGETFVEDDPDALQIYTGDALKRTGIQALEAVDLFNLLCLPGVTQPGILTTALQYCESRRAVLIIDAPPNLKPDEMLKQITGPNLPKAILGTYAAIYYPWVKAPDPLKGGKITSFPPSGMIAGLYARTDSSRGVWKAPAGTDAALVGVQGVDYLLNDDENGSLNPHGVNCLRIFPVFGAVSWGARTVSGDDQIGSDYKYIPVRRTALFIEESLYRGLKWAVFEPNDEPLWGLIRLNVGAFMQNLFIKGAFQGQTPKDAYFVKCDKETTTQNDINLGIVNVLVGFAPLKPAEFVIVQLQQIAGQIQV